MKYTFIKTQLNHCPNVTGWYLKWNTNDSAMLSDLHQFVTVTALLSYKDNPHLQKSVKEGDVYAYHHNPVVRGQKWIATIEKYRSQSPYLLINKAGGWMFLDNGVKVIGEIQSDKFQFPTDEIDKRERITISIWPDGKHYYLTSSKNTVIPKCDSLDEAMEIAKKYALPERIKVEEKPDKLYDGD